MADITINSLLTNIDGGADNIVVVVIAVVAVTITIRRDFSTDPIKGGTVVVILIAIVTITTSLVEWSLCSLFGEPRGRRILCAPPLSGIFPVSRDSLYLVPFSEVDGDGLPGDDGHVADIAAVPARQRLQDEDDLQLDPIRLEICRH